MGGKEAKGATLRQRIRQGKISREDVLRRLAELAFGQPNDCVRLALENEPDLRGLDLSLLSEIKRSDKGMVEIKLIDRLRILEKLEQSTQEENDELGQLLLALRESAEEP